MSNRYYDTQMLALAHPAQYKNELQAAGDGFMNMYSNYLKNRLNKNEVLTSDLGLEFMNATQDDRIKQAKLDTNIKQNQADLNALELDTAKQIQKDTIEQTRLKTLSDSEKLKQEQFATKTQPEIFNMQKSLNNAQINNLNSSIAERNFSMFLKKHAFNENERATNSSMLFQNFLNDNNLQGDDNAKFAYVKHLDDEYNYALNNPLLNDSQRAKRLSEIQKIKLEFAEYLPQIARANSIVAQGFNSFSSKGGNGGDDYSNVLTQIGQVNAMREQLKDELDNISTEINIKQRKKENIEMLEKQKVELEQKLSQLQNIPNTANAKNLMNYFTDSLGKSEGAKTYNQMINYSQIKQDITMVAEAIDTVALYGWTGEGLNKLAHFFGVATNKDDINNKILALLNNIQGDTGAKLKQQYENIVRLTPNTSVFGMNVKRMQQELKNLNEHINININSILYPHKENAEVIKKSFNISTEPLKFNFNYENYKKMINQNAIKEQKKYETELGYIYSHNNGIL